MDPMKIAILGATGRVGTRLTTELVTRGHQITGISRHPGKLEAGAGVTAKYGDVQKPDELAKVLAGHDAVIHSVTFANSNPAKVVAAVKQAGVKRLLVVGGAGSLEVSPGVALIDTPGFPEEYKAEAGAGRDFLVALRKERELDWTFLSPAVVFLPGERTGRFRTGGDQLMTAPDGPTRLSMEDYAIAMADEIENPKHSRARFSVAY